MKFWMRGAILCFALVAITVANLRAQDEELDLRFVTEDAFFGGVINPQKILASQEFELLPKEIIGAMTEDQIGIDVMKSTLIVAYVRGELGPDATGFGLVFHFEDAQTLGGQLLEEAEKSKVGTRTVYSTDIDGREVAMTLADKNTLVITDLDKMEEVLESTEPSGPFVELVQNASQDDLVAFYLAFSAIRDTVVEQLPVDSLPPIPALRKLASLPAVLENAVFRLNIDQQMQLSLALQGTDEAGAEKIEEALGEGLEFAAQAVRQQLASEMDSGDDSPIAQATSKYLDRVVASIQGKLTPSREGDTVTVTVAQQPAVVGVLVGLLLPAVQKAREAAERMQSSNNLKMLALAMHNYESVHRRMASQANYDANGKPLLSWRVHLLPYLEQNQLYEQFHLDEPWDSEHNKKLIEKMPDIFKGGNGVDPTRTIYQAVVGKGTLFANKNGARFADVLDGTSNTIMFVEANAEDAVIWTKPEDISFEPENPLKSLGFARPGGFNVAMCDGSVRFVSSFIDPQTMSFLLQIADGNVVNDF